MAKTIDDIKKLRDEIVLKLHLASMDAKREWDELEPKLEALEHKIDRGSDRALDAAAGLIDELGAAFRSFRDRLTGH